MPRKRKSGSSDMVDANSLSFDVQKQIYDNRVQKRQRALDYLVDEAVKYLEEGQRLFPT